MNYDHDVIGVGNPSHPANQTEVQPEQTLAEKYEDAIGNLVLLPEYDPIQSYVNALEKELRRAIEVMEALPEDSRNYLIINRLKNVLQ